MFTVYKLNSHTGLYTEIGCTDNVEKAEKLAKELSTWSTPYCNEVGRAKVTDGDGTNLFLYEDGFNLKVD